MKQFWDKVLHFCISMMAGSLTVIILFAYFFNNW